MRLPNRFCRRSFVLTFAVFVISAAVAADSYPKRPLNDRVLVALVEGAVLPESLVVDVREHGLAFSPSDQFLSRLADVGATPAVIDAVRKASIHTVKDDSHPDDHVVLDHLFAAGEKLKDKKWMEAAGELTAASNNLEDHPELAFAMAEIMRQENADAQASALLSRLIEIDPEFPEAHTKLSFELRDDDAERGIAEATAALARTPNNAEAHKSLALNLEAQQKYDAAIVEYQKALAIKPDYSTIHFDLGVLYFHRGDYRNCISETRKALASDPSDAVAHYNLAQALKMSDQLGSAISEYREAIRLAPNESEWRIMFAYALVDAGDRAGGIEEFRKLIRMSPDSSYCHRCFGGLLYQADQIDEAAREYSTAIQLDAADADSHYGLGLIYERKHQQDAALKEFQEAVRLGKDSWGVHSELARIYTARKQNDDALTEIKQAVSMAPSNGFVHEQLADILSASGNVDEAIVEYGQAFELLGRDSKEAADASRKAAALYEKSGNYAMALRAYRGMYDAFPTDETRTDYEAARARLSAHLPKSALQEDAAAQTNDPEALTARWQEKSHEMQQAMAEKRWKDADSAGKEAIALAEQMQPQDARLIGTISVMGMNYSMQSRFDEAEQQYVQALKLSEKLAGPDGLQTMFQRCALGRFYFERKKYSLAIEYLTSGFDLAQKLYGQTYAYEILDKIGQAYQEEHMFGKAEEAYRQMLADDEIKNGPSSPSSAPGLEHLGVLYCDMGRYSDAESALDRVIAIDEKQFGPNSPSLGRPLDELSRALRGLGRENDAKAIDQRRQLLAQNEGK